MLNATEHDMVSEVGYEPTPPFGDQNLVLKKQILVKLSL